MNHFQDRKEKTSKTSRGRLYVVMGITALVLFLFVSGILVADRFFAQKKDLISLGFARTKGALSFFFLGSKPGFYFIDIEKNGRDYRLTSRDTFEVTYRDEFVVKDIVTDAIFG